MVQTQAPPPLDPAAVERALHRRVNEVRAARGRRPLRWSDALRVLALRHSRDMARRGYFSHTSPEGTDVTDRARRMGLTCARPTGDGRTVLGLGENLFMLYRYAGYQDTYRRGEPAPARREYMWRTEEEVVQTVVEGWMQSTGHRENLLRPHFETEGLGIVLTADDRIYVTQAFC